MQNVYKRILLKLSGEVLAGKDGKGIDFETVNKICKAVKDCADLGVQIGLVVGGGNFWRGRSSGEMDRTRADHMGMLATAMNSLALADTLEQLGVPVRVQTAITMQQVAEPYIRRATRSFQPIPQRLFVQQKSMRKLSSKRQMLTAFMTKIRTSFQTQLNMTRLLTARFLKKVLP